MLFCIDAGVGVVVKRREEKRKANAVLLRVVNAECPQGLFLESPPDSNMSN